MRPVHLRSSLVFAAAALIFAATGSSARAAVIYDEGVSGDAGVNANAVNLGSLTSGSHVIVGGNLNFDTDDFSLTIGAGLQLDAIFIDSYTAVGSAAMQTPFLGLALLSSASAGQDFLDLASISQPVGAGTYLFRATTGTGGPTTYQLDFQVSAVPEPASLGMLAAGAGMMLRRRKRQADSRYATILA